jgi:putative tryptophan/tyrosine transport system substrate-binding protein
MRRREFIAGLGSAAAWPLMASAQQGDRVRRIAVLMVGDESDVERNGWLSEFTQGLAALGWTDGRNARLDVRWHGDDADRMRMLAKELAGLKPDVILSVGDLTTAALHNETRTIPIVFVLGSDPVGSGYVAGLPRPGGNITGFGIQEAAMGGKWLALLAEIAPGVKRAAIMFNPDTAPYVRSYYLPSFEAAARSLKVARIISPVRSDAEIKTVIGSFGREPGGGLVIMPGFFEVGHRELFISLAARNNLPAVYPFSVFVRDGGLLSYAPDTREIFHRSASYVDRILRGEKPAELPVQLPIKFQMAINLKTAKALGLTMPNTLLVSADEVIE